MKSQSITELAKALAAAQSVMKAVPRNADNPFFKSRYADLAAVWDAIRAPLTKHGLSVTQTTETDESGRIGVRTTLIHSSGEWIDGFLPVNPIKNDPQSLGSAITYARRYALSAIAGAAAEGEDDDANAASQPAPAPIMAPKPLKTAYEPSKPSAPGCVSEPQVKRFWAKVRASGKTDADVKEYLGKLGIEHTSEMKRADYEAACKWAEEPLPLPPDEWTGNEPDGSPEDTPF